MPEQSDFHIRLPKRFRVILLLLAFIAATGGVSANRETSHTHNKDQHLNFVCALHKAWPGWWHTTAQSIHPHDDFIGKTFDITDPFSGKPAKVVYEKDKDPREEGFTKGDDVVKSRLGTNPIPYTLYPIP